MLSHEEAEAFYDRFGAKQDGQGFYEDVALDELIAHAEFEHCSSVVEIGCGTGRFAHRLLSGVLSAEVLYLGLDVSGTMVELAKKRLESFGDRVQIQKTDGSLKFPVESGTVDRVVSTYVTDLLSEDDLRTFLAESHRVLAEGGRLCVAGLTPGQTVVTRIATSIWTVVHRLSPARVGGCRPLSFDVYLDQRWHRLHRAVVSRFGIPSEILIAERR